MSVTKGKKGLLCLFCLSLLLSLSGCEDARFTPLEDYEEEYEAFGSFDVRELGEQVEGFWTYYEENKRQKEHIAKELTKWKTEYLKPGEYTVGRDTPAGLYICKTTGDASEDNAVVRYNKDRKLEEEFSTQYYRFDSESYILLREGGVLTISKGTKMAFADGKAPSLAAEKDGIYYSGSYKVGEEIPKGEYFMLSFNLDYGSSMVYKNGDRIAGGVTRFGYVVIDDARIINMEEGVLIPLDKKPSVRPIKYQGEGEGAGKQVYSEGIYKIGADLPPGTYKMKNELYRSVTDLSYEGYHGNESYYPRRANRAGISAEEEEDARHFGWLWLELDCKINNKTRYLKTLKLYGDEEDTFQKFKGLPTVTFTEEDMGWQIRLVNCVLIPEEDEGKGR